MIPLLLGVAGALGVPKAALRRLGRLGKPPVVVVHHGHDLARARDAAVVAEALEGRNALLCLTKRRRLGRALTLRVHDEPCLLDPGADDEALFTQVVCGADRLGSERFRLRSPTAHGEWLDKLEQDLDSLAALGGEEGRRPAEEIRRRSHIAASNGATAGC